MTRRRTSRVGIRERRQNLSMYVKRIREEGVSYEVTERGEPVAQLTPLPEHQMSTWDRLVAEGRIVPPTRRRKDVPAPLPGIGEKPLSEVLREMREDEPW